MACHPHCIKLSWDRLSTGHAREKWAFTDGGKGKRREGWRRKKKGGKQDGSKRVSMQGVRKFDKD